MPVIRFETRQAFGIMFALLTFSSSCFFFQLRVFIQNVVYYFICRFIYVKTKPSDPIVINRLYASAAIAGFETYTSQYVPQGLFGFLIY